MKRRAAVVIGCAVLAAAACTPHAKPAGGEAGGLPTHAEEAQAVSIILHHPRDGVYASGQPSREDWAGIASRGIGTVINLRTQDETGERDIGAEVRNAGMDYMELPIDGAGAITPENASKLHKLMQTSRGDVLVQCASANRSGGLLAVMAAQEEGMNVENALAFGRAAGMRDSETRVREVLQKR